MKDGLMSRLMGEWWRPKGPVGGEPRPAPGPRRLGARVPSRVPLGTGLAMMPQQKQEGGVVVLWDDSTQQLPTTTYASSIPRVVFSAEQTLSCYRIRNLINVASHPIAFDANTRLGSRIRIGRPVAGVGSPTKGHAPGGVYQPGYAFRRNVLRVSRYSTQPLSVDAQPAQS